MIRSIYPALGDGPGPAMSMCAEMQGVRHVVCSLVLYDRDPPCVQVDWEDKEDTEAQIAAIAKQYSVPRLHIDVPNDPFATQRPGGKVEPPGRCQLKVRIPVELRDRLKRHAAERGQSLNDYLFDRLTRCRCVTTRAEDASSTNRDLVSRTHAKNSSGRGAGCGGGPGGQRQRVRHADARGRTGGGVGYNEAL